MIELRREGLSVYEISTRLTGEGTPLGRTAVSDILREEGFGRLLRGPAPEASTCGVPEVRMACELRRCPGVSCTAS